MLCVSLEESSLLPSLPVPSRENCCGSCTMNSTSSRADGRFSGSLSRQRAMMASTSSGHSSGTLKSESAGLMRGCSVHEAASGQRYPTVFFPVLK